MRGEDKKLWLLAWNSEIRLRNVHVLTVALRLTLTQWRDGIHLSCQNHNQVE